MCIRDRYYSVGGGFVMTAAELAEDEARGPGPNDGCPFPFKSAAQMLEMASASGNSIADLKRANELTKMSAAELDKGLAKIWDVMNACIDRGVLRPAVSCPGG